MSGQGSEGQRGKGKGKTIKREERSGGTDEDGKNAACMRWWGWWWWRWCV